MTLVYFDKKLLKMLKISIVIPTYNRPAELKNCISSILKQTIKPNELIIVDDGNLKELPLEQECKDSGVQYIYFKKDKPGLTASKNKGVKIATGDIIFFLDDDVVLLPDYIEEILNVYKGNKEDLIGGVGGLVSNFEPLRLKKRLRRIFDIFFLISGFNEGMVLPSGFCTAFGSTEFPIKKTKEVDFLPGGVCSYRKEIFKEFLFDSIKYLNYGQGEDKDFSYQISKKYKLLCNPKAKLLHFESPKMKLDKKTEGRMFIIKTYLFFSQHVKKGSWSWLLFYYALSGYIASRTMSLVIFPRKWKVEEFKGFFSAIRYILKGDILKVQ